MMNLSVGNRPMVSATVVRPNPMPKTAVNFAGSDKPSGKKKAVTKWAGISLAATAALALGSLGVMQGVVNQFRAGQPVAVKAGQPQAAEKEVVHVTDVTFDKEVLQSDVPVLVTFGAEWCGPCQRMKPELKKLANDPDLKDKIKVVKVDIDQCPKTTAKYVIDEGIPDTRFFKKQKADDKENSQVNERHVGYRDKDQLKTWVNKFLDSKK